MINLRVDDTELDVINKALDMYFDFVNDTVTDDVFTSDDTETFDKQKLIEVRNELNARIDHLVVLTKLKERVRIVKELAQ